MRSEIAQSYKSNFPSKEGGLGTERRAVDLALENGCYEAGQAKGSCDISGPASAHRAPELP